jgi:hypothetical protein
LELKLDSPQDNRPRCILRALIKLLASLLLKADNGNLQRILCGIAKPRKGTIEQIILKHPIGNEEIKK